MLACQQRCLYAKVQPILPGAHSQQTDKHVRGCARAISGSDVSSSLDAVAVTTLLTPVVSTLTVLFEIFFDLLCCLWLKLCTATLYSSVGCGNDTVPGFTASECCSNEECQACMLKAVATEHCHAAAS